MVQGSRQGTGSRYRLVMNETWNELVGALEKGGRSEADIRTHLNAVISIMNICKDLEITGVGPRDRRDALGYCLVNMLATHYTRDQALGWLTTLGTTLEQCYAVGLGPKH